MVKGAKGIIQKVPKEETHDTVRNRKRQNEVHRKLARTDRVISGTRSELTDEQVNGFLSRIAIAPRLDRTEEVQRLLLSGNFEGVLGRACKNTGDCNIGLSIHYSKKSEMSTHYNVTLADRMESYENGTRNVKSIIFQKTELADKVLSQIERMLTGNPGAVAELHLLGPHETMVLEWEKGRQAITVNPCLPLSGENVVLVARFQYMLNEARKHHILLERMPITGHGGFRKLDGMVASPGLKAEDATLNMLAWVLYMGKLGAFDLEIMPQYNLSSEYLMGDPSNILIMCSAPNVYVVPDIAHIMLNNKIKEFDGPDRRMFKLKIRGLLVRLDAREKEFKEQLAGANTLLKDSGVPVELSFEELKAHLQKLECLYEKGCGNTGKKGLEALFAWLDVAKRLEGIRDQKRLMRVAHVVLAAARPDGSDANMRDVTTAEEAMKLFKTDRPFREGASRTGDGIMQAIIERAALEMARDGESPNLLIVDESPPESGKDTLFARVRQGKRLRGEIGKICRQIIEGGTAAQS
ncbi:MAG: hypothetical protein Q7T16_04435 [Candidatus Burarchaeum sp.]|nr:hypothetical protein [Candidatus Burarchaeum sp.]MDO8339876.1 hypothetical protein [Candidatus Burarchaeum sp.]